MDIDLGVFEITNKPTAKLNVHVKISEIPCVKRLAQAIGNVVKPEPDGVYCSCGKRQGGPMMKNHAVSCIELSEAIKEFKANIED